MFSCNGGINMKEQLLAIRAWLKRNPLRPAFLSMGWNLTFALINGVISLIYSSYWYLTLFAYSLLLGLMKMSTLMLSGSKRRTEADMLRQNGVAMFCLAVIVCGLMVMTIRELHNPVKNKIVIIATAAYTFSFVGLTIYNTIKAHIQKSTVMISLRNISCASALISILSLERSMLGTFGDATDHFPLIMQAWSGGAAFLILIGLGISMLCLSKRIST